MANTVIQDDDLLVRFHEEADFGYAAPRYMERFVVWDSGVLPGLVMSGYSDADGVYHPAVVETPYGTQRVDPGDVLILRPRIRTVGFEQYVEPEWTVHDVCTPADFRLTYDVTEV